MGRKLNWMAVLGGFAFYYLLSTILYFMGIRQFMIKLIIIAIVVSFTFFIDSRKRRFKRSDLNDDFRKP